ncbi:MATH domain-containing protein [Dichanthelium oligosanthes]|uniref:MATH domain-containing protein n=1 Tax=Dichanthelium oligosanthes TaxID=888268 RepID=A0A1E5W0E9_9POAL|nr:MATH domain-containing protein [Dichanthelium oligosanthes]
MAGSAVTDDSAASTTGMRDDERSLSGESLSEWRSCERADSDSPSTSPPFWDSDGDDDDPGPKPSELFGRYTWRIENFSKEKKREMKSEPFEAGGYKWYILVYPQGCDVSNHLSLFLCVANHDKLLPGWSHFAQFTIAVGNVDPKKMKYSDTLHRFWKKEHDWGWKKFMELSKIQDGFLVDDVLEIIAQVQMSAKKGSTKVADLEELPAPMVHIDMDMFVLAGDVIPLIKRAALEPLPCQPLAPKDDKTSQSRMKDGTAGEVYKVSMEREERRLTELGQKILETFVLSHIFGGIEVAYQEAVALKRQEELIREEEEAGLLENQMKGKRGGGANEKDKRAKKKQAKQKKNNRKVKDKERDEKCEVKILERLRDETAIDNSDGLPAVEVTATVDALEEGSSDGSDMPNRGKTQRNKGLSIVGFAEEGDGLPSTSSVAGGSGRNSSGFCTVPKLDQDTVLLTLRDKLRKLGQRLHEKNIEGQKLLKAHFEARDAKAKEAESSNSSSSLEKPPDGPESPKHSSEVSVDLKVNGTPNKDVSVVNCVAEEAVSGIPAPTNTEPVIAPDTAKLDLVSNKDNGSSLKMKANIASPCCSKPLAVDMDKDAPLPSKSPRINRAASAPQKLPSVDKVTPVPPKSPPINKAPAVRPKSPAVDKTIPVRPKSPAVDKAAPVRPKSPAVDKATPIRPKSPAVDKIPPVCPKSSASDKATPVLTKSTPVDKASPAPPKSPTGGKDASVSSRSVHDKSIPAPPRLPQVDKAAPPSSELPQTSRGTNSEAQEAANSRKVTANLVSEVTASRPSSAPVFPTPRSTAPATSHVHISSLLSRSMSEAAGRSVNVPSPSAPPYAPQTYRNAIVGKTGLGTTSASLAYQSTSLSQDTNPSQPLSAYASSTAVMMPPAGRSDQLSTRHVLKSGLGKLEAHDSWQQWKGDSKVDKHLWRVQAPYQQMTNGQAYEQPRRDDSYQQASSRGTEKLSRYGGLPSRQFQSGTSDGHVWHQQQGPVPEEFPHLDIINDLLEEDQINGSMPDSFCQDYHAFDRPFSPRGNLADMEMAAVSSPGRFNSTDSYYDEGFSRSYDMSALHGLRERQFPSMGTYSNGLSDMTVSKPWLNGSPNPAVSLGVSTNGYHHQVGDYTNLGGGVNGVSVWRRHANGRW